MYMYIWLVIIKSWILIESWIFVSHELIQNPLTHVPEFHPIPKSNKEDEHVQQTKCFMILITIVNTDKNIHVNLNP